jgi:CO/xanthine dehydrogenase FAD-binding subunit
MIPVETFNNIDQASNALDENSVYFGGGTLLMRALNYGDNTFGKIIRSTDASLTQITDAGDRIKIGAGVTMASVISNHNLAFLAPVARSIGGPAIRNMATVGGNLFARHPYGDFVVALLALDGKVLANNGTEQDLEQFLQTRDSTQGIISSVSIRKPNGADFRYKKVSRVKPKGISVMSIASSFALQGGRVSNARLAFGAMGNTPMRAKSAEAALEGASLDASGIQAALQALAHDLSPPDDAIASSWYRSQVAPVHLRRLLLNEGQV